MEVAESVRLAVAAALDRKAEDLHVLHVGEVTHFTDYFVVCSGTNPRQVHAIADAVAAGVLNENEAGIMRAADEATNRAVHVDDFEMDVLKETPPRVAAE